MNSLSHLRLATAYARFTTSSASSLNRLPKATVPSAAKVRVSSTDSIVKESWLTALSCPLTRKEEPDLDSHSDSGEVIIGSGSEWIIGVDPDVSGALALLRPDQSPCGYSAEVLFVLLNFDGIKCACIFHKFSTPMFSFLFQAVLDKCQCSILSLTKEVVRGREGKGNEKSYTPNLKLQEWPILYSVFFFLSPYFLQNLMFRCKLRLNANICYKLA